MFLLVLPFQTVAQFYNGSHIPYQQNRVQYRSIDWQYYRTERFDIHYYAGGKQIADDLLGYAQRLFMEYEERLNYTLENRLQILVFNRLSDLKQSNLGTGSNDITKAGGVARLVGNSILLYGNDGTFSIEQQLREGIVEALVAEFIYGSNMRERLRSSSLVHIPEWFDKGLVRYLSSTWSSETDNQVRNRFLRTRNFQRLNRLHGEDAAIAGHSVWNYIADIYGEKVISGIVETTRMSRHIESGFTFMLGVGLKGISQEWQNYYDKQYFYNDTLFEAVTGEVIKTKHLVPQAIYSPDRKHFAYVQNDRGRIRLYIQSNEERRKTLFKTGKRLPVIMDLSFPVVAWNSLSDMLVFTSEEKGRLHLNYVPLDGTERTQKNIDYLEKINHMSLSADGKTILMSGMKNGKNDIYLFNNVSNTFKALTQDAWDDQSPVFLPGNREIVFSSNRETDSLIHNRIAGGLPVSFHHDLFLMNLDKPDELRRLTDSPLIHETKPVPMGDDGIYFLSDKNGIRNLYKGIFDSSLAYVDTIAHYRYFMQQIPLSNVKDDIANISTSKNEGEMLLSFSNKKTSQILRVKGIEQTSLPLSTWVMKNRNLPVKKLATPLKKEGLKPAKKIKIFEDSNEEESIQIDNYKIGTSERSKKEGLPSDKELSEEREVKGRKTERTDLPNARIYLTAYYPEEITTQVDRGFINMTYQPYSPGGYVNPAFNGLFKVGLSDVFEDYKITGAFRLATSFSGNEYLLGFLDQKKRMDKYVYFHRQGLAQAQGQRVMMNTVGAKLVYPLNEVAHVSGGLSLRNDRHVNLSTDLAGLTRQTRFENWSRTYISYMLDQTFPLGGNLLMGSRFSVMLEYFQQFNDTDIRTAVLGMDYRKYVRINNELVWASRLGAASSFGPRKLVYYLGGVDNWLFPVFNQENRPDESQGYIFQALATNVRGFTQNIRNGNSFAVINTEMRWNFMKQLMKHPLRSDLLNNLVVVSFFDAGTAFTGTGPYSEENTFNQETIVSGPITVVLKNQREPLVAGYGIGLRSKLLGYHIRIDLAQGVERNVKHRPVIYLTFASDF